MRVPFSIVKVRLDNKDKIRYIKEKKNIPESLLLLALESWTDGTLGSALTLEMESPPGTLCPVVATDRESPDPATVSEEPGPFFGPTRVMVNGLLSAVGAGLMAGTVGEEAAAPIGLTGTGTAKADTLARLAVGFEGLSVTNARNYLNTSIYACCGIWRL